MRVLGAAIGLAVIRSPGSISGGQQPNPFFQKATFGKLPIYFILVLGPAVALVAATAAQDAGRTNPSLLIATFSKLSVHSAENRGTCWDQAKTCVQGAEEPPFFTKKAISLIDQSTYRPSFGPRPASSRGIPDLRLSIIAESNGEIPAQAEPATAVWFFVRKPSRN